MAVNDHLVRERTVIDDRKFKDGIPVPRPINGRLCPRCYSKLLSTSHETKCLTCGYFDWEATQ